MHVDHHLLHQDFPELKDRINELKASDHHFAKMLSDYNAVTEEIRRIEEGGILIGDSEMEKMKLNRIHLKDKLYARLKA